jgi:hypothetical protein
LLHVLQILQQDQVIQHHLLQRQIQFLLILHPLQHLQKYYVLASGSLYGSDATYNSLATIYRDSTNLATDAYNIVRSNAAHIYGNYCMSFLDSPSTTSQIKYQVYIKSEGAANTVQLNLNNTQGIITAFEIAG